MIFLKQIKAIGFKSFANLTTLNFTGDMTGIIGPNGSGKSNISDAIRWTLGEQSNKMLRGSKREDIVFGGSSDKKGVDVAEVTLTFNTNEHINEKYNGTIEITRKYNKDTKENFYYINNEICKLKDIQEIAMDLGLTRSSMAIISQGTISNFSEVSAEQRREIFDEAAGIIKYKKRKKESLNSLEKIKNKLEQIEMLINEYNRKIPSLKKQSEKAIKYNDINNKLLEIEKKIYIYDIKKLENKITDLKKIKTDLSNEIKLHRNDINISQAKIDIINSKNSELDNNLSNLHKKLYEITNNLNDLNNQKTELENQKNEAYKYTKDEYMIELIKNDFEKLIIDLKNYNVELKNSLEDLKKYNIEYTNHSNKYNEIYGEIKNIVSHIEKINIRIEHEEDKQNKLNNHNTNAILVENKNKLPGVIDIFLNLIEVDKKFEIPFSITSSALLSGVVVKKISDTKKIIEFLKNNNCSRVTLLALDAIKSRKISDIEIDILKKFKGFISIASDLVTIKDEYKIVSEHALGSIVVVDNYKNALEIARQTNFKYNIVSLDAQRVLPNGAIMAGSSNRMPNLFEKKAELSISKLKDDLTLYETKEQEWHLKLQEVKLNKDESEKRLNNINFQIRELKNKIDRIEQDKKNLNNKYNTLTGLSLVDDQINNKNTNDSYEEKIKLIITQISKLEISKLEINEKISNITSNKANDNNEGSELNQLVKEKIEQLNVVTEKHNKTLYEYNSLLDKKNNILEKLFKKYDLTLDDALKSEEIDFNEQLKIRENVEKLSSELESLNYQNINFNAIEEYKIELERFNKIKSDFDDINNSKKQLEDIIFEIDIKMETKFKSIINDVNEHLPIAFSKLFGGGTAEIIYVDPNNILETGIEIKVHPPGKKISNLNLLSGGEKSLVALSVLFSILKVRPLPLVVLDEVEAPLDIVNVERFAKYLKLFCDKTQFIIVTHREGTMKNCDILFGVTMESKGITKIVNVDLKIAKKLIN